MTSRGRRPASAETIGNGSRLDLALAENDLRQQHYLKDVSPSTREASSRWVEWDALGASLGQPFDNTKIPYSKLFQMRKDPMIAFALMLCKVFLVRAPWFIKCQRPEVAAAVDNALRSIWGRLALAVTNDFDFGHSPVCKRFGIENPEWTYVDKDDPDNPEKPVWTSDVGMIVWKPFMALNPRRCEPAWTREGEFNGIYIGQSPTSGFDFEKEEKPTVPLSHALWATNEKDSSFGDIYGYPRTGYAYRYWWSYWYRFALADRAFERFADPALIVYHPTRVIDDQTGEETDLSSAALSIGEDVRSGATVAIPNSMLMGLDERLSGVREWEVKPIASEANFDALNKSFEYLDIQKIRAIMVPEQALVEGKGGTSSRNVAAEFGDLFQESMAVKMAEIDYLVNSFVIPQFVELNFGPGILAQKVTRGFDPADLETMREVVRIIGQADPDKLQADVREMMERLGMPVLSLKEIQEQLKRAEEIAEQTLPPPVPGDEASAGVTKEGLYYLPRERLALAQFPSTRHYEVPEVRAVGDELHLLFEQALKTAYESFARFLVRKGEQLKLADEGGDIEERAAEIVRQWGAAWMKGIGRSALELIQRAVGAAGRRELVSFGLSTDSWRIDRPDVQEWMRERGTKLVRGVEQTVREELREFLAREMREDAGPREIAKKVREHFAEFPTWKADRIARTEIRDAYNAAALMSYKGAGVKHVQAFDGAGGLSGQTDPECLERNGEIFELDAAMRVDEHPNGTLGWRPVMPTNFSFEIVPQHEIPVDIDGAISYWEAESQTLYLAEGLSRKERTEQLLAIGERLCRA